MMAQRRHAETARCACAGDLDHFGRSRFVRVAGLGIGSTRPSTASGVLFPTLEDETGNVDVVVWTRLR